MAMPAIQDEPVRDTASARRPLIYRHKLATRLTHWFWAICLFFLLLSGLQIFNAHPSLYIGDQSGFGFANSIMSIGAEQTEKGPIGFLMLFGHKFETTGWLGLFGSSFNLTARGFPEWATIPSYQDLATGRVVHFFFAWLLAFTLLAWLVFSIVNGHARRDIVPDAHDLKALPRDVADHARLRFRHTRDYNPLQKLSYAVVLFVLLPGMIVTGLAMSPGFNAAAPWLPELLGGRQTARTLHFVLMLLLVGFFLVHMVMVVAAGPFNELRSMVTGWYRADPPAKQDRTAKETDDAAA